jgi:hypothetical protein
MFQRFPRYIQTISQGHTAFPYGYATATWGALWESIFPCPSLPHCGLSGADSRHPRHTVQGRRPSFRSLKAAKGVRICAYLCKLIASRPWSL